MLPSAIATRQRFRTGAQEADGGSGRGPRMLPTGGTEMATTNGQLAAVERACRLIKAAPDGPPSLEKLAAEVGLSPPYLQRLFKRHAGVSPREYADAHRVEVLAARLKDRPTVTAAMHEAGYGSRLYERATAQLGMTPGQRRGGGRGQHVAYTLADSPLGRLLLAATERGVCALSLGDADGPLETWLRAELPAAELRRDDDTLAAWLADVLEHLAGRLPDLRLPLDVRATAFQRQVWQALQAIPFGQTRTYKQVAAAVGKPRAIRAVARACATNPVSLVVPCHRVVRCDGGLAGYRWGVDRKRRLLEAERPPAETG
jgi:AraC family transcriptional regulator of adaptative response/methylated-DNA-[protein]-cysteine methyltransferase